MSFLWGNTAQQPKEPKKFANISNDQVNSIQQAIPVKYLAGRNYVAGDYISPAYNPKAVPIKTQTGKSQSSTTGYKYFADFALLFCMGGRRPVDAVYKVIVDSDIRWSGNITRGNASNEVITVPDLGTIKLYWGTDTQGINTTLLSPRGTVTGGIDPKDSTTWPAATARPGEQTLSGFPSGNANPYSGHYDRHPGYRGQCYAVFKDWKLGRDRTSIQNIQLELKRGCPWFDNSGFPSNNSGVNPILLLFDWLTDTRFGMGVPESSLNHTVWNTAYNAAEASGMRLSPLITQQADFRQIVAELLEYIDGWIRRNGTKIEVGIWQHGTITSAATLTDGDLLGEPDLQPQAWGPTFNEVTVVYKDKDHHFNDYTQVHRDPNNFRITGGPRPETLSRPWITDATLAKRYAREAGAAMALPVCSGDLKVKREWLTDHSLLPGKVITYNSGFYGLSFLLRLLDIEHAADTDASATITVEWERSKWPTIFTPPAFQGPGGFVLGPRAIWKSSIREVPYLIADGKFDTQVIPLAVRGNVEVQGFRTWISLDGGSTYEVVPESSSSSAFCSFGRLYAAITVQNANFGFYLYGIDLDEVVSQDDTQWNNDNLLCFIDSEVLSVGRVNHAGHGLFAAYCKRGRFGTTRAGHAANTNLFFVFRDRMRLIDNASFTPGTEVKFKLQPFTADEDYDLAAIAPITYTITGFADVSAPILAPSPGAFVGSADVTVSAAPSGFKPRYTTDGTPVGGSSREWPKYNGAYTRVHITKSTQFRVRFYSDSGRFSSETIGMYTKVAAPGPGQPPAEEPQCGAPSWDFSGTRAHTSGTLTLIPTTVGSVIHYSKNDGPTITYTTPISIACNIDGDTVDFWATKAGMSDSQHRHFDNSRETTYGGGQHLPPHPPQ